MATRWPGRYVVASTDKDLKQIPGLHYNWKKERVAEAISAGLITGSSFRCSPVDSTDGYAGGCPGIGECRARRVLEDAAPDMWARVVAAFESRGGLTEEDALIQARVARILRAEDYDFEESQPILWSPA